MERIWKATSSWFFYAVPPDAVNQNASFDCVDVVAETPDQHLMDTTDDVIAETPDHYLMRTKKCLERLSLLSDQAAKFNQEQCKYLAGKLDFALRSAQSIIEQSNTWYFSSASREDMIGCLEIFKLLLLMGLEAEGFIQDCYKDEWIQNAIMLTNVSEHVASIGFNLEICTIIFSNRKSGIPTSLTPSEVKNLRQAEAEIVKEKSDLDEIRLCVALSDVTRLRLSSSTDWQLATFLLGRLKSARLEPGVGSMFSMESFEQKESLGTGASGTVHRAMWLGIEVAMKTFEGPSDPDFLQEVSILAGLSHPNIVSLLWYPTDPQCNSFLIMELMDGDLLTLMKKYRGHGSPFSILEAFILMLQTAEGMLYLHERNIVHRDLKSKNILVKSGKGRGLDFKHVQVKVADFGLSKTKENSMTFSHESPNRGTTRWMAPEVMAPRNVDGEVGEAEPKYPFKSDVYSFGMVCFEILTGKVPFSTVPQREVRNVVLGGGRPQLPAVCPSRLRALIEACWSAEASTRPHFGHICAELRHLQCAHLMTSVWAWARVPHSFSLNEIRRMTNEFDEGKRVGFDKVYKGAMVDTGKLVLVERVRRSCGLLSPDRCLEILPRLHHENLMGYVGYCYENGERILVFEYMPNYTLAGWLLGDEGPFDDWAVRRNICLGVANGIYYLHTDSQAKIIRHSINLHNIFLDANLEPKIGGFWRECSLPECGSEEEDVYNYGVVLLEIVSRRIVRKLDWPQSTRSFCYFWEEKNIDPALRLQPKCTKKMEAMKFLKISLLCIDSDTLTRPDMACVVAMLQGNLDEEINRRISQLKERFSLLRERFASQAAASALVLESSHHGRNSGCVVPPVRHTGYNPPNNFWGSNIPDDLHPRPTEFPDHFGSRPSAGMSPSEMSRWEMSQCGRM